MKKIFGLAALIISLTVMAASAESEIFISATHSTDLTGGTTHDVLLRASLGQPDANTMMIVKDAGDEIVVIDQGYADGSGNISYSFGCDTAGVYTGYINTDDERVKKTFSFEILSDYQSIVDQFNGADESSIAGVIDASKSLMLFDTKYYTDTQKAQIAANMLQEKGSITVDNITEAFDKSVINAYLYGSADNDKKLEVIEYYDNYYFGLINQTSPKNLYSDFLTFTDGQKNSVFGRVAAVSPELSEFRSVMNEAIAMTAFAELDAEELDAFILNNTDYIALSGYENYTPAKRKDYITALKASNATDITGMIAVYDGIIAAERNQNTHSGNGGSGGSSGGSSAVWVQTEPEKNPDENPDEKQEPAVSTISEFKDLDGVEWAKPAVSELQKRGIVSGKADGIFAPGDNVSRAEFTAMAINAFIGLDAAAECSFTDISKDDWCYGYVATGYKKGIALGRSDGSFGKNDNITREDMAAILHRVLSFTKSMPTVEEINNTITDFSEVSEYAKNSVLMLSEMKVVSGVGDGYFLPKKNATRAEAAVMIYKAMEVVAK